MERRILQGQCWDAFIRRDHEEAVRLLPLQDPDVLHRNEPDLLYYSIRNGWLDVTRYLITKYHFDPRKYYLGESCLYIAAEGNHVDIVEYLIKECGCDPMMGTTKEYDSVPVLHYVANEGLLNVLKCMVMNINGHIMDEQYCDTNGRTVLHYAVKHIDVVKYLINECNCDIMTPDEDGDTILHVAASEGSLDVMKYLINTHHYNLTITTNRGETVLHCAVRHIDVVKYLINECNCDIMTPDEDGDTILHDAASEGSLDVMKYLINTHHHNLTITTNRGETVLHRAVRHIDVVKYLINECNCDIMATDKDGFSVLHYAAGEGSLDVMKYLVNTHHYNLMTTNNIGWTVLHCAFEHIDVVKYLINECHCDIMTRDKYGNTILHYAASKGSLDVMKYLINTHHYNLTITTNRGETVLHCAVRHIDVVKYLINECNCDIMTPDEDGDTILHVAASEGSLDVMKYLINTHHYNLTITTNRGETVLHRAVRHIDVVKYLINECNCDIMATDKDGFSVLHYAAGEGSLDVMKYLVNTHHYNLMTTNNIGWTVLHCAFEHIDVVKYLINECHCDIMTRDKYGNTILHYAASKGSLDVMKYLINTHHYNLMTANNRGRTVLHCAVRHIDVVKYLINECNCDIMATNKDGFSVLHYAASEGSLDVMKYLVNTHHYNLMTTNNIGWTVLHCAVEHIDVVKYLINECNCDIMATDKDGFSVLHYVASKGLLDVFKCMVMNINGHIMDKQYRDTNGRTVLHCAVKHIDVVKYLINECSCNIMVTDKDGWTSLHDAARLGTAEVIEYFLSTGNCDPLAKSNEGWTPLQLAKGKYDDSDTVIAIFKKFGDVKISHPIDSYVNVLLVGNPGAGKSTLSNVINDTATGSIVLGSFRNVGGVVPCTAGIIPYKLQHRTLGNIILHDFAGHSEYYSSHSAVIENLLQGSGGVFLIVVNILEKEAVKQLHQWLTVVRNEAQKALNQCHVIVIVSHVDKISNPVERNRKEEIQEIIVRERCDSVLLDCRKLGGSGMDSFFKKSSIACESICSTSGRNLSLYCHMMYGLLEERKENILTLSDVMSAGKDNKDYFIPDKREDILDALDSLHSTGLISILKSEDKVWVVVNKGILLTEVDGILFAPKTFKEHVDIASNTGIISVSGLTRLFPKYDPDMLICFLKNMELCQELNPFFLRMTNLHQLAVGEKEEGGTERRGERLLFFPCLLSTDRPDKMTSQVYQFGWCLQCTSKHDFFPPRYFHVLSLRLAYKKALPQEDDNLNRYCTFWKNGLYWFNGHGVGSLVEIVDESQCVLVMMSCEKGYSDNMVSLRRDVIGEVMIVYKESCPSLEVKELVIDPKELAYPVNAPRERTVYSVKAVLSAAVEQRPFLVTTGTRRTELKEILPDESLTDISNLSLLGGHDIKVRINTHKLFDTLIQALIIKRTYLLFLIKLHQSLS